MLSINDVSSWIASKSVDERAKKGCKILCPRARSCSKGMPGGGSGVHSETNEAVG